MVMKIKNPEYEDCFPASVNWHGKTWNCALYPYTTKSSAQKMTKHLINNASEPIKAVPIAGKYGGKTYYAVYIRKK
jgi:hypothetical protein